MGKFELGGVEGKMSHHRIDTVPTNWIDFLPIGRRITALAHDPNCYYHGGASLLFDDGGVLTATTDEHNLARLFDCFTLALVQSTNMPEDSTVVSQAFEISEVFTLVRDEWLVPAPELEGETIGNNPHTQFSGPPGSVPEGAVASATLLAGIFLIARDGQKLAIVAAESIPLNVDVVTDADEVEALVSRHACRLLHGGVNP